MKKFIPLLLIVIAWCSQYPEAQMKDRSEKFDKNVIKIQKLQKEIDTIKSENDRLQDQNQKQRTYEDSINTKNEQYFCWPELTFIESDTAEFISPCNMLIVNNKQLKSCYIVEWMYCYKK